MPIMRMLVHMSGQFDLDIGDLYDCDDAEAGRLVAAGYAEPEDQPPPMVKQPPAPEPEPAPEAPAQA